MAKSQYELKVKLFLSAIFYWCSEGVTKQEIADITGVSKGTYKEINLLISYLY
jgi:hypothetical protein